MATLHNLKPEKVIKTFDRAGEPNMQEFTEEQLKRQDFVDNEIYDFVKRLLPSTKEIEWNIEMIGDIRDTIQYWLVDQYKIVDELEFYP